MILTINVNAALDRVFFIERFIPNTHMRTDRAVLSVGGKGLDTALVLQTLGAPVRALSFIAGKNGETLAGLLEQQQISSDLIWLPGETRESIVIVETDLNRHSHITTTGYTLRPEDIEQIFSRVEALAPQADWAVIAGTLPGGAPPHLYHDLIERLHRHGVKVLIDGFGPPILETLPAQPDIVKMNQAEFEETFNLNARGLEEWVKISKSEMERRKIGALVITCGKDGILAFTPAGVFHAGCIEVKEVNAAGAGDAVSAALAYRLSLGETWSQALAWAVATSAAVVLTEGTAEAHMADILELYPRAWVKQLEYS